MRTAILTALITLTVAGCGSARSTSVSRSSTSAAVTQTTATGRAKATCASVPVPAPRPQPHLKAPGYTLDPSKTYTVTVTTNCGSFRIGLDVAAAPKTTASVYALVKQGFYDGLMFQRVVPNFVIQGGDPLGNGTGGPGYTVVEPPPHNLQYVRGIVAMAKTQAQPSGASGSQFFVVATANASVSAGLTPVYALVGKVVSGMGVVEAIDALPVSSNGSGLPTPPVVMSKVTVSES